MIAQLKKYVVIPRAILQDYMVSQNVHFGKAKESARTEAGVKNADHLIVQISAIAQALVEVNIIEDPTEAAKETEK